MAIEKRDPDPHPSTRRSMPLPAMIVIGALAVFGLITAVQFALSWLVGFAKFLLVVVVVVAVAAWVISAKGRR
jgi:hypothetical protein